MKRVLVIVGLCLCVSGSTQADGIASQYQVTNHIACSGQSIHGFVAAHKTLPCGSQVRVTNQHNGRTLVARIIDRGPFIKGRVIDVSNQTAAALGFNGLTKVSLQPM